MSRGSTAPQCSGGFGIGKLGLTCTPGGSGMVHIIGVNPCLTGVAQCTANGAAIPSVPTATDTATTIASVTPTMSAVPLLMLG